MSIDAGAQVAIILLACRPYVVIVNCLGQVIYRLCIWVELPVQRRLCPIFVSRVGSGHPTFTSISRVDG